MPPIYPLARSVTPGQITPSIHWAQYRKRNAHKTVPSQRRIYDFELLYLREGELLIEMNNVEHLIKSGTLVYIPAGVVHRIVIVSKPYAEFMGVHFDFFDEIDIHGDMDMIVNENNLDLNRFCREPEIDGLNRLSEHPFTTPPGQIVSWIEFIIQEYTDKRKGYELTCNGLLLHILSLLYRTQDERSLKHHIKYGDQLSELARLITSDLSARWSNQVLAEKIGLHEDYLAKIFKQSYGVTPQQFLQRARHQEAKRLLRDTEYKMSYIATMVGYEDFHYFSRIFHRLEGMSAQNYRSLAREL